MYVTRYTKEYFQYHFDNINSFLKSSNTISNVLKSNIEVLFQNINLEKTNSIGIIKSIILIKYLRKTFNIKLGIIKSDQDYFSHIIKTNKHDYTNIIRLIKLTSFIIEKYVKYDKHQNQERLNNNTTKNKYNKQNNYQQYTYNIETLDIIIAFGMFDKYYKKNRTITQLILLNDSGFVMALKNYLIQKTNYVNQGFIDDLYNNDYDENKMSSNLVDKDFYHYCYSNLFTRDINQKYDDMFNVKTIFKTIRTFNNFNVKYYEIPADIISDEEDNISENTELDIIQDESDNDININNVNNINNINDLASDNMSENYGDEDDDYTEELQEYTEQDYDGLDDNSDYDEDV
jgi:hypothetical protein